MTLHTVHSSMMVIDYALLASLYHYIGFNVVFLVCLLMLPLLEGIFYLLLLLNLLIPPVNLSAESTTDVTI